MKSSQQTVTKKRLIYAAASLALLGMELCIALFISDRFIRPYAGDFLAVILIHCFLRILMPERPKWLPLCVFIFSAAIEAAQGLAWFGLLNAETNPIVITILGSTFSWEDIGCYAAGCLTVAVCEWAWCKSIKKGAAPCAPIHRST